MNDTERRGLFQRRHKNESLPNEGYRVQLITERGNGFYAWNGKLYQSDIIRSCIRPKAKAMGKLIAKHIRDSADGIKVNPDAYMRFLLEEPNPYMTGQMMQEKLAIQLALNNNAFALILRDANGYPIQLYPIPCVAAEALYSKSGELMLRFSLPNGKQPTFMYSDIIHLRHDFYENDIFGESPARALTPLMEIVNTTDQGIVKAIKNSAVVRWIMTFANTLKSDDRKLAVNEFVENYLNIDESNGVAIADPRYTLKEVEDKTYVPNATQMDKTTVRLYNFFGTNEKIIQSKYGEDDWNAYYESEIEPDAQQWSGEYTRKLFTRKERGFGNKIIFEASSLQYASMSTKLNLLQMVDRGALLPNEWRNVMNMGPIEGGEKAIRRLDTAVVNEVKKQLSELKKELIDLLKGGGAA